MNAPGALVVRIRNGVGEVLTVSLTPAAAWLLWAFGGDDLRQLNAISDALEAAGLGDEIEDGGAV